MSYEENKWLEKYEIKAPDYDFFDRGYCGMSDARYTPARFYKEKNVWKQKTPGDTDDVKLMFTGDITCFERQIDEARVGDDYNFDKVFEPLTSLFSQADLAVGNIETMLSPSSPYRTEMYVSEQDFHCNAPVELLDAIRKCGVDMLSNANNHDLDTGVVGLGETIDNIRRFGFIQAGTYKEETDHYDIFDINGIRIAIIAFEANGYNGKDVNLSKEGHRFLFNNYSPELAKKQLDETREKGAEVVVASIHWGKENWTKPHKFQYKYAKELAAMGYDCIVGSHSHVLQPFDILHENGNEVPVYYCIGNLVSHNVDNYKARAAIASIDIRRENGEIKLECSYIPVFTSENYRGTKYVVLPIAENTKHQGNREKAELISEELGDMIKPDDSVIIEDFIETPVKHEAKKKRKPPKLTKLTQYPVEYDGGKFVYEIYPDHLRIMSITAGRPQVSYTTSRNVLGLPVTEIQPGAFENHAVMKKIKLMENILTVPKRMCKGCKELEGFRHGNNTHTIEEEAFADCSKLQMIAFRSSMKRVESKAFANCTNLRSAKVGAGVEYIADDAFEGCGKLVFYCDNNQYAEEYAKAHGFPVVRMALSVPGQG